jgi:Phosphodiester glycosidase/Secretion system C-terminal sorting domain/Beta-propeller repeat
MKKNLFPLTHLRFSIFIISIFIGVIVINFLEDLSTTTYNVQQKVSSKSFNQLPMQFEKNLGQAESEMVFLLRNPDLELLLSPTKAIMSLRQTITPGQKSQETFRSSVTMGLANSNPNANGEGLGELLTKSNYFIGNDPAKWQTRIPNYKKVLFSEVYPGVDLVYYAKNGKLEFDFNLFPGADPKIIKLEFQEDNNAILNKDGKLILKVGLDSLIFREPIAYQEIDGIKNQILASYVQLNKKSFGFVIDNYDETEVLVIDPVIEYSTFLRSSWRGEDIAVDKDGFVYITGDDCCDVFVTKLHPDSSDFIYTTYFGGDMDDFGLGIDVDTAGYVYVTGETQSDNFPLQNAKQSEFGGTLWLDGDAFVTKLSKNGSSLEYSTYLGGDSRDIGSDIKVDIDGNAYIAGETISWDFPVENAYQESLKTIDIYNWGSDAFITKYKPDGSGFVFSTYFGGGAGDEALALTLDSERNIYITGFTWSLDLPTTAGVYRSEGKAGDAFVTKMNAEGNDLVFSTYLTGENDPNFSNVEWGTGIAVNGDREVYVVGKTWSPLFPTVNAIQENHGGNLDGFVTKLKPDGSDLLFSTFLGGSGHEEHLKIALDAGGNAFITGQTGSDNFPIEKPIEEPIQNSLKGLLDAFVSGISSDGKKLFISSYLGGSEWDQGRGIAVADNSHIFITGHSNSVDFPLVSPLKESASGGFVTEISLDETDITWSNKTATFNLPNGISIFEGTRIFPKLKIYYIDADLNIPELSIRPYIRGAGSKQTVNTFNKNVGAYASINGGFFYKSDILSAVVYPKEIKAKNIKKVTRKVNNIEQKYPVIRSLFSMKNDKSFSVDWIYHISNQVFIDEIFTYENPLAYVRNDPNPKSVPSANNGEYYSNILTGIGGGPVLIKDGKIKVTYDEEILWGSGVGYANRDPRSAVGYTADKHIIMIVADGRSAISEGVGLPELAEIMSNLGCVEALNLDGGGSSQMAIGNTFVNIPSDPVARAVPSILSIIHIDSLNLNKTPVLNYVIDTEGSNIEKVGSWSESSSPGAYGSSNALLIPAGVGNNYISYNLEIPHEAEYELYAWWVADTDRCMDSPFIIDHKNGTDTIRMDQSENGSFWNMIGNFTFTGTNSDRVKITDGGTTVGYICADAIRIVSEDKITSNGSQIESLPVYFKLRQNYPNPFNPSTTIKYSIPIQNKVTLEVFDALGSEVATLVNKEQPQGNYEVEFDGAELTSGIYFYRLKTNKYAEIRKMILLK